METLTIDGLEIVKRKHAWVGVWSDGNAGCYHFRQVGSKWFCRHPFAMEDICSGTTLEACMGLAIAHHKRLECERAARRSRYMEIADDRQESRARVPSQDRIEGWEGGRRIKAA